MPNQHFLAAVDRFFNDQQLRLSQRTLSNYIKTLRLFAQYHEEDAFPPSSDDLREWLAMVKNTTNQKTGKPISDHTVHTYWTHLRVFFNYCENKGLIAPYDNPVTRINREGVQPKRGKLNPVAAPENDIIQLLDYLKAEMDKPAYAKQCLIRDYTIILFLFTTGVRAGELVSLRLGDIDLAGRGATIRAETSKAGESRPVALDDVLCQYIRKWLAFRHEHIPEAAPFLFVSYRGQVGKGRKLGPNAINLMLKKHGKAAGIPHSSTHKYRHAFAVGSMRNNVPPKYVQQALGHKSFEMTMRYYQRVMQEEQADYYRNNSIANRLNRDSNSTE